MPEAGAEKHPHMPARHVIDRIVLGGSDGAIESVALISALNGAGVAFRTIILAGLAFAIAGAVSMFFSNYLARRSELDALRVDMDRERMEIETEPEEEKAELEELLRKEGYAQKEVDVIMGRLEKDKEMWLREQLDHELKVHIEELSTDPVSRPASAGVSFFALALLVLSPYWLNWGHALTLGISVALSITALFALGSRAFIPRHFNPRAGVTFSIIGACAAALLYGVGLLISGL